MSEPRVYEPTAASTAAPSPALSKRGASAGALIRTYPWAVGAVALLVVSTGLVLWTGTRPGYDPYGWLVWGHLTVHLNLDTNGAPSWKPLGFLFTVPYALVGHYALWLWMITSVAISLSGVVFAWRIAYRLTAAAPERRYAAYAAGAFAAAALLGIANYMHFIFSAQSDTMIVSMCLAAIDCQLSGRLRWAFWLWVLGSLGRPEVWPFLGLYSVWAWWKLPSMRRWILAGLALIPLLWFGIPALTAKTANIAGSNALHSPRELHGNKITGTLQRFFDLQQVVVQLAALLAAALAAFRRDRVTLMLAAGTVTWVVVEVAFALHGFPAVPRYLFEPAGVACVLAGVFLGRVILDLPPLIARVRARLTPAIGRPITPPVAGWATGLLVLVLVGAMVPAARSSVRIERKDLTHERARTKQINRLSTVVKRLGGGSRILACGQPNMPIAYQSVLAWYMGVKIGELYFSRNYERLHPHPLVNFVPHSNGWQVFPSHVNAASAGRCRGLRLTLTS
ncbi:MAG: hypothetical protein ACR2OB_05265 [Solirubrobacteraceae bacterium]